MTTVTADDGSVWMVQPVTRWLTIDTFVTDYVLVPSMSDRPTTKLKGDRP